MSRQVIEAVHGRRTARPDRVSRAGDALPDAGCPGEGRRAARWPWLEAAAKNAWLDAIGRGAACSGPRRSSRPTPATWPRRPALGLNAAAVDRLTLDPRRIDEMARSLAEVAALPDPVGEVVALEPAAQRAGGEPGARAAGRHLHDLREPAQRDRRRRRALRQERQRGRSSAAARRPSTPTAPCTGSSPTSWRPAASPSTPSSSSPRPTARPSAILLGLPEFIDLAIPRGGESLIRRVAAEAKMPVMKHYQGICPVYVDAAADPEMAIRIILNAKVQRPGVCNAAETLLVHRDDRPDVPAPGRPGPHAMRASSCGATRRRGRSCRR